MIEKIGDIRRTIIVLQCFLDCGALSHKTLNSEYCRRTQTVHGATAERRRLIGCGLIRRVLMTKGEKRRGRYFMEVPFYEVVSVADAQAHIEKLKRTIEGMV